MGQYEDDSWLHLQQCELIGEDGGFQEVIIKDGCSTDDVLYQLQGKSFLKKPIQNFKFQTVIIL